MKTRHIRIPFLAASAVSLAYYAALKIVDPVSIVFFKPSWIFNFSLVWLVIAVVLVIPAFPDSRVTRAISRAMWGGRRRKTATVAGAIFAGTFAAVSLALAVWIMMPIGDGSLVREPAVTAVQAAAESNSPPAGTEYLVVLGGGIRPDGSVSLALKSRLDAAIAYLARHPDTRVVVTGGKLRDLPRSEGEAMTEYLLAHSGPEGGLAPESVLSEEAARDTIQNMANVRDLILKDIALSSPASAGSKSPSVIILTNEFHLKRSLYLARIAGYENARGIAAPSPAIFLPHNLLREVGAWWKLGIRQAVLAVQGTKLFAR
jgi:uncharacterized SAM-binding protein YcdF (DUF218 family)